MTKATQAHKARVVALGCIVCRLAGIHDSPAELHHPRGSAFETGVGRKADDKDGIGLCHPHHRTGGYGVAYHAGPKAFERNHGTQAYLLGEVRKLLG
jgi:hypothetical protein